MISRAFITEWRDKYPWNLDSQVEQDLILSRLLVELFSNTVISRRLRFRGATAIYKLFYKKPLRYSEDIDLVQKKPGPIGKVMGEIRRVCNPLIGKPGWSQAEKE